MITAFLPHLLLFVLAFVQNVSFSIVSRSRNRDNMKYHLIASLFSNSLWFLTFRELVRADMTLWLFPAYCFGTMLGSVLGAKISMRIEAWLGATADPKKPSLKEEDVRRIFKDLREEEKTQQADTKEFPTSPVSQSTQTQ